MLISICQSKVTIQRQTAYILSATDVSSSVSVSSSPPRKTTVQLEFTVSQTGTAIITGSLDSSSVTETIKLSSQKFKQGVKQFDSISSIDLDTDLVAAGGTVAAKSVGRDGSPQTFLNTIVSSYPAAFKRSGSASLKVGRYGSAQTNSPYFLIPWTSSFIIQDTDVITNVGTSEVFFVVGSPIIEHIGVMQHWRVKIQRKEQ